MMVGVDEKSKFQTLFVTTVLIKMDFYLKPKQKNEPPVDFYWSTNIQHLSKDFACKT